MSKLYTPRTAVARYYLVLFTLPKWEYLVGALTSITFLAILILGTRSAPALMNSAIAIGVLACYRLANRGTVFWKVKRIIGMALAVTVYSTIYTAVTGNTVVPVAASATLFIVVLLGLDGTSAFRYAVAVTPPTLSLAVSRALNIITEEQLKAGLLVVVVAVIADLGIYLFMSRRKIGRFSLADIGTLFLRNWLDRKLDIERIFEETGRDVVVRPRIIELPSVAVVYTDVHYGPFSNVGSSRLPERLVNMFSKIRGVKVLTLHGLGSHDRNIVSSKYVDNYVASLKEALTNAKEAKPLYYYGALSLEHGDWRALVIVFSDVALLVVSRRKKGIDDIPYWLQEKYEALAKELGIGDLIIIDAHNWELVNEDKTSDIEGLETLLEKAILRVAEMKTSRSPVEVYSKFTSFKARAPGLIGDEGYIFCVEGSGREEACIVYLRGNNMKPGVRDKVLEHLKPLGTDLVEVITNDEHTETATRSHIVYIPVHESPELFKGVGEAAKELATKPPVTGAFYLVTEVKVRLMGRIAEELEKALKAGVRETAVLLPIYVFVTPVVASLLL